MAEFEPVPEPPTPEEKRAQRDEAIRGALERVRFAMICTADVAAGLGLELARESSRHLDRMGAVSAVTGTALQAAEAAGRLLAAMAPVTTENS